MTFLINYWWLIIVLIAAGVVGGYAIFKFFKLPTSAQLDKVKEWLVYAVAEAEKELGSKTGQLKLRYVYDLFLTKFSFLTKVVTFETFSGLVDEALEKFKSMLESNEAVSNYVRGEE